jgi:predicted metal-dependent phosphoesterase TrpH
LIDLHIHTTSSDGSDEPQDILVKAQKLGLKYISITDHDSLGAYEKLGKIDASSYFEGKIIPGCEFSVVHNRKPIEVLGYGIDLETIDSTGIVSDERFLERENEYIRKMKDICRNLNLAFTDTLSIKSSKYFATQVIHADLRKYPENEKHFPKEIWESVNAFYRTCINNEDSPFFLNQTENYPTVQEAAELIKRAGGKAFLAHIYGYFADDYEELLNSIVSLNALDGIECYHSLHSMDRTSYLLNYCNEHKLYASGGSDYHGTFKPTVYIGESISGVKIPFEILEPWLQ